ncbi:MAG: YARHG domain-containing protein [Deltaproteobacteria bacterium]|nr:MAG: YARHG domain-containing protein [Deltaproteobacteria bacterium]
MKKLIPSLLAWLLFLAPVSASAGLGPQVAQVAEHYLDTRPALSMETCNGLIEDVLRDTGVEIRGSVRMLYADMQQRGWVHTRTVPRPGDLVFFDNTYDANRNGRQDDPLSHIAIVISVDPDHTVHMVHHGSRGITPLTMNLRFPSDHRDRNGKVVNSFLAANGYGREGQRLSGELWRAFATPEREGRNASVAAIDRERLSAPIEPVTLPVSLRDPALRRAWEGRRVAPRHLRDRTCYELWFLRNAVYASHGFAFNTFEAQRAFSAISTYRRDTSMTAERVRDRLTRVDHANVERILKAERAAQCR